MNYLLRTATFLVMAVFFSLNSFSQEVKENNQKYFGEFLDRTGNMYRSASGKPGPEYWQNEADYQLEATINDATKTLSGKVTLNYTNNSPEDLDFIWMYLEQNRFMQDSRGNLTTPIGGNRYNGDVDGGYNIKNLKAVSEGSSSDKYIISDTRMQVFFDKPVKANGGKATVSMDYTFKIPEKGMDRMGRLEVKDGTIYAIAQWYPRVAVFDDIEGWNVDPYLGAGEFYLEYGDFDYKITMPYNFVVVGSGELQNPKEVMSSTMYKRWEEASKSEETVFIIKPEEVKDAKIRAKQSGNLTWHFKMENTRDVAFATSKAFIWDAAKMNLKNGKTSMAQSVYPMESAGQDGWGRSTQYTKAAIENYSTKWFTYPYQNAINVACAVGGMEYPGMSFCDWKDKNEGLWGVTDHEFGHNWFPMIVGSNERRYAWMDEGFNTFINYYSTKDFNNGEYPATLNQTRRATGWFNNPNREGIDTYPDVTNLRNLGMTAYYKPATGLYMLREYILGPERFDNAFKTYIKTWAYKHPQPQDFFNVMDNVSGENLSWFWKGWFYGTGNIDFAIEKVDKTDTSYVVNITNKGEIPMPIHMKVKYTDGSSEEVDLPVEIWERADTWQYEVKTSKILQSAELDPNKMLPDVDGNNDIWTAEDSK